MREVWRSLRFRRLLLVLVGEGGLLIGLGFLNSSSPPLAPLNGGTLRQWQQVRDLVVTPQKIELLLKRIASLYGAGCQQMTVSSIPSVSGQSYQLYGVNLQLEATSDLALKRIISHLQNHAAAFVQIRRLEMRRVGRLDAEGLSAIQMGTKPKMVVLDLELEWIAIDAMAS